MDQIKLLVLGDRKVGKTSLIRKFLNKGFRENYLETIGTEISTKQYVYDLQKYKRKFRKIEGKHTFNLQILDYSPDQVPDLLNKHRLFFGNTGIIFVFNLTEYSTYINLTHTLIQLNEKFPKMKIPILFVGNYADKKDRTFSNEDLKQYIETLREDKRIRSKFIEYKVVSVKDDVMVDTIFTTLADEIIRNIPFKKGRFVIN